MIKKLKYNTANIVQTSLVNLNKERDLNTQRMLTNTHVPPNDSSNRISVRELHKYVMGLIGIFLLFSITYPIAIFRFSHQSKVNLSQADGSSSRLLSIQH
jgi:hypothetical protein